MANLRSTVHHQWVMHTLQTRSVERCEHCWMHVPLCLCELFEPIETRSTVQVFMHAKERGRSSNSGRLVRLALQRGDFYVRGLPDSEVPGREAMIEGHRNVVLYPSDDATPLTREWAEASDLPVNLMVPDGNWRQAKRTMVREPALKDTERVCLLPGAPSRFRLRTQSHDGRLATFEAITRALGILEGEAIEKQLEHIFDVMVERTLWTRGQLPPEQVTGGIPQACIELFYGRQDED